MIVLIRLASVTALLFAGAALTDSASDSASSAAAVAGASSSAASSTPPARPAAKPTAAAPTAAQLKAPLSTEQKRLLCSAEAASRNLAGDAAQKFTAQCVTAH